MGHQAKLKDTFAPYSGDGKPLQNNKRGSVLWGQRTPKVSLVIFYFLSFYLKISTFTAAGAAKN
jgi:hypothetical protein